MGRPPLPLGTYGRVLYLTTPGGLVKARVKFRDFDGRVRLVSKTGSSRAAAERALKEALTSRRTPGGTTALTSGSRMTALVDAWLAADHGWSTGTERTYRSVVKTQVKPAFGQLCLRVWTTDVTRAHRTAARLQAGYVWVNGSPRHFWGLPFGGVKSSGVGREESLKELLSYTETKAVTIVLE